jgi:hypothetical protein
MHTLAKMDGLNQVMSDSQSQDISYELQHDYVAWFEQHLPEFGLEALQWSFDLACSLGRDFNLVNMIVQASKVDNHYLINMKQGCLQAFNHRYYALCLALFENFAMHMDSKDEQREQFILLPDIMDLYRDNLTQIVDNESHVTLIYYLVLFSPNHTKKIHQRTKHYQSHWTQYTMQTWEVLYNDLLALMMDKVEKNQHPEKLQVLQNNIQNLAQKPFPLIWRNIHFLKQLKLAHIFENRLNRQAPSKPCGLALRTALVKEPDSLTMMKQKLAIFQELLHFLQAPYSINIRIHKGMGEDYANQIPNDTEYAFLHSLENKPYILNFFKRYYLYDRKTLKLKLDEQLPYLHEMNYEMTMPECVGKI